MELSTEAPLAPWMRTKLDLIMWLLQAVLLLCGIVQCIIDTGHENLISVLSVVGACTVTLQYLIRSRSPVDHPLSCLALLGLAITAEYASLVAQTLSWTPLVQYLRAPVLTFGVLGAVLCIAVGAHWLYRHLAITASTCAVLAGKVMRPLGVLDVPPVQALWVLSVVGALSAFTGTAETGDVSGKAFQALSFMAWLPFLIPFYHRQLGEAYCSMRRQWPLLIGFTSLLVVIGLARNARQLMFIGPVQGLLIYLVYALRDPSPPGRKTLHKLLIGTVVGAIGVVLLTDLVTAMVLAREKRAILSPMQMVEETIASIGDRARLDMYRDGLLLASKTGVYDEAYLSNPVLARFSETKFHDNMIFMESNLSDDQKEELWKITGERLLLVLPQNLLDALDIKIKKDDYRYSMGDYYLYLQHGSTMLGGFVTGSVWADMLGLFGPAWPVVTALLFILTYIVLDALSLPGATALLAPAAMCSTWPIFLYGMGGESLVTKLSFLGRDLPQKVLLYLVAYWGVSFALGLFRHPSSSMAQGHFDAQALPRPDTAKT